jgi:predicted TIM-barrel fold metal-dependent hydrolase
MTAVNVSRRPATLDVYLSQVVTPTLERLKREGAVAIKYEAAYLRPLNFTRGDKAVADRAYARYTNAGVPTDAEYTAVQDVVFHHVAVEAGRLGLPVHIHTGYGCGGYFELAGSNPLLLEPVLDDASLRKTKFVLLHGGAGPFSKEIAPLLMKPNVYTDFSEQTWLLPTRELARSIRYWLEWYPEKVLFGTDLSPGGSQAIDWEEIGWQTTTSARDALAIALTEMVNEGEITRPRATEIAKMVMRGNALRLYGWPDR